MPNWCDDINMRGYEAGERWAAEKAAMQELRNLIQDAWWGGSARGVFIRTDCGGREEADGEKAMVLYWIAHPEHYGDRTKAAEFWSGVLGEEWLKIVTAHGFVCWFYTAVEEWWRRYVGERVPPTEEQMRRSLVAALAKRSADTRRGRGRGSAGQGGEKPLPLREQVDQIVAIQMAKFRNSREADADM